MVETFEADFRGGDRFRDLRGKVLVPYCTNFVSNFTSFVLLVLFVRVSLNGANFVLATAPQPLSIGPLDRVLEHAVVFAPV